MAISDRVCVMHGGVIAQEGSPEDIYKNPKSEFVARFIGHYNVYSPDEFRTLFQKDAPSECRVVAIRPEALTFESSPGRLCLNGKVMRSSMLGSVTRYQVDCGSTVINMEILNHDSRRLQLGEEVAVYINEKNILYVNQ